MHTLPHSCFPYWLNLQTLYSTWSNKGAHARTADTVGNETFGCWDEENFHADHHTLHRANFGLSSGFLDFYFGTQGENTIANAGLTFAVVPDPTDASKVLLRATKSKGPCRAPWQRVVMEEVDERADDTASATAGKASALAAKLRVITRAEMAAAVAGGQLWLVVYGGVFDVSAFARIHPGGAAVLQNHKGDDATAVFSEVGHSPQAKTMALKRLIGFLEGEVPRYFLASSALEFKTAAAPSITDSASTPLLAAS